MMELKSICGVLLLVLLSMTITGINGEMYLLFTDDEIIAVYSTLTRPTISQFHYFLPYINCSIQGWIRRG